MRSRRPTRLSPFLTSPTSFPPCPTNRLRLCVTLRLEGVKSRPTRSPPCPSSPPTRPALPAGSTSRAPTSTPTIAFYSGLFGWEAHRDPRPEAGGYTMFSLKGGKSVAAASPPQQEDTPPYWTTYLASDDVDETAARVREAGGVVFVDPFDVFDAGRMTIAQDPTGACFALWQASQHIGAQLANEPGTLSWNECRTPDAAAAEQFYRAVFGYSVTATPMGMDEPYRVLEVDDRRVAGLMQWADGPPRWVTTLNVAHTDASCARAEELGARAATAVLHPVDRPLRRARGSRRRRLRRDPGPAELAGRRCGRAMDSRRYALTEPLAPSWRATDTELGRRWSCGSGRRARRELRSAPSIGVRVRPRRGRRRALRGAGVPARRIAGGARGGLSRRTPRRSPRVTSRPLLPTRTGRASRTVRSARRTSSTRRTVRRSPTSPPRVSRRTT